MQILMTRSNGQTEDLRTRERLVQVLYRTNVKAGTKPMTYAQCGIVANKIMSGCQTDFCGRHFDVRV